MKKLNVEELDFEKCEDEPIHIPEAIQGYGYLFALDQTKGEILLVSENIDQLLKEGKDIVGKNFFKLLKNQEDTDFLKETHHRAKRKSTRLPLQLSFEESVLFTDAASQYHAVVYDSGRYFVVELEPASRFRESYSARHYIKLYALSIAPKFRDFDSLTDISQEIVETIKYITEMERVVLYKFHEDGSGKVIAEARDEDIDSYLHVHYPAKDIPKQARELYKKNWVRLLPNVNLDPSPIYPSMKESNREPLDMTHSILRDLSPIHRQYVRNQGLESTMSMSLVTHDKLWGMISCHSRKVRYVPQNIRLECENLSQLFSWHLYAKEEGLYMQKKQKIDTAITRMLDKTSSENPIVEVFKNNQEEVLDMMEADGFIFYTGEAEVELGVVPELSLLEEIFSSRRDETGKSYISSQSERDFENDPRLKGVKGILMFPLLEHRSFFTAWFRKEHFQVQKWAGVPEEDSAEGSKKQRLSPRKSFKVHEKEVRGQSKPWDHHDIDSAYRLNKIFMAHTLEMQEKLQESIDTLELENRYKNEFLATLAHELRNPLTPISSGIALLEMEMQESDGKEVIDIMKRQVKHMTTMINDLMDVSRITRGKINLKMESYGLKEIIYGSLDTSRQLIDFKNHQVDVHLPEEELYVRGDATRLNQIFNNIIHNAAKYTDSNGKITLTVERKGDMGSVRIRDNGQGIPSHKLNDIFSMFTQVDADSTHTKGGLGIGLTLVKKLVELHDGMIYARSEGLEKGSEFEVLLPLAERSLSSADGEKNMEEAKPGLKVLLVDDNEDLARTLALLMRKEGMITEIVFTGEEALEVFPRFKPDIAVFDIGMPDIDGYELCRRLIHTPEASKTVFFSHSGWANTRHKEKAKEVGFREHLVKPLDMKEFKALISDLKSSN